MHISLLIAVVAVATAWCSESAHASSQDQQTGATGIVSEEPHVSVKSMISQMNQQGGQGGSTSPPVIPPRPLTIPRSHQPSRQSIVGPNTGNTGNNAGPNTGGGTGQLTGLTPYAQPFIAPTSFAKPSGSPPPVPKRLPKPPVSVTPSGSPSGSPSSFQPSSASSSPSTWQAGRTSALPSRTASSTGDEAMMCPRKKEDPQPPIILNTADCFLPVKPTVVPTPLPTDAEEEKEYTGEDLLLEESDPLREQNRKILNDMAKIRKPEIRIGDTWYKWIDILPRVSPGVHDSPVRISQDYIPMPCDPEAPHLACGVSDFTRLECVPKGMFGGAFSNSHHCVKMLGNQGDACRRANTPTECKFPFHCMKLKRAIVDRLKTIFDFKSRGYACISKAGNTKDVKELKKLEKSLIGNQGYQYGVQKSRPRKDRSGASGSESQTSRSDQ